MLLKVILIYFVHLFNTSSKIETINTEDVPILTLIQLTICGSHYYCFSVQIKYTENVSIPRNDYTTLIKRYIETNGQNIIETNAYILTVRWNSDVKSEKLRFILKSSNSKKEYFCEPTFNFFYNEMFTMDEDYACEKKQENIIVYPDSNNLGKIKLKFIGNNSCTMICLNIYNYDVLCYLYSYRMILTETEILNVQVNGNSEKLIIKNYAEFVENGYNWYYLKIFKSEGTFVTGYSQRSEKIVVNLDIKERKCYQQFEEIQISEEQEKEYISRNKFQYVVKDNVLEIKIKEIKEKKIHVTCACAVSIVQTKEVDNLKFLLTFNESKLINNIMIYVYYEIYNIIETISYQVHVTFQNEKYEYKESILTDMFEDTICKQNYHLKGKFTINNLKFEGELLTKFDINYIYKLSDIEIEIDTCVGNLRTNFSSKLYIQNTLYSYTFQFMLINNQIPVKYCKFISIKINTEHDSQMISKYFLELLCFNKDKCNILDVPSVMTEEELMRYLEADKKNYTNWMNIIQTENNVKKSITIKYKIDNTSLINDLELNIITNNEIKSIEIKMCGGKFPSKNVTNNNDENNIKSFKYLFQFENHGLIIHYCNYIMIDIQYKEPNNDTIFLYYQVICNYKSECWFENINIYSYLEPIENIIDKEKENYDKFVIQMNRKKLIEKLNNLNTIDEKTSVNPNNIGDVESVIKNVQQNISSELLTLFFFEKTNEKFTFDIKTNKTNNLKNEFDFRISGDALSNSTNLTFAYHNMFTTNETELATIILIINNDNKELKLTSDIQIEFLVSEVNETTDLQCVWTKENMTNFETNGCKTSVKYNLSDTAIVTCTCNHMTSFAVMFGAKTQAIKRYGYILSISSYVPIAISIIFLILTIKVNIINYKVDMKKKETAMLALIYLFVYTVFLIGTSLSNFQRVCNIWKNVTIYSIFVLYTAISLSGYRVYKNLINFEFEKNILMKEKSLFLPWILPIPLNFLFYWIVRKDENKSCFLSPFWYQTTILPIFCILIVINLLFLFLSGQKLLNSTAAKFNSQNNKNTRKLLCYLTILLGITWALQFTIHMHWIFELIFNVVNGCQGCILYINSISLVKVNAKKKFKFENNKSTLLLLNSTS